MELLHGSERNLGAEERGGTGMGFTLVLCHWEMELGTAEEVKAGG